MLDTSNIVYSLAQIDDWYYNDSSIRSWSSYIHTYVYWQNLLLELKEQIQTQHFAKYFKNQFTMCKEEELFSIEHILMRVISLPLALVS